MAKRKIAKLVKQLAATHDCRKFKPSPETLLSTGSTMLNLACSDKPYGGIPKGTYVFFVGDSSSGKTFLTLTCMAESRLSNHFKHYRLIYNDVEHGALMDMDRFFGSKMMKALEVRSTPTVEEFYFDIDDAIQDGRPFIYVLDSMDALSSHAELDKFKKTKRAIRKIRDGDSEEKVRGSFGDGKAKKNSEYMRQVLKGLENTGSILIVVCQTRDNIDAFSFETKTRSGGHSLKFYAQLEIWTAIERKLKVTVHKKPRLVGVRSKVTLKKNRITGKLRTASVPIYNSVGIDDIGSCIDFLVEEGIWTEGTSLVADEFDFKGRRDKLIRRIEEDPDLYKDLKLLCWKVWKEIEEKAAVTRKSRYE